MRESPSATDEPTRPQPITTTRNLKSSRPRQPATHLGQPFRSANILLRTLPPNPSGPTLGSRVQTFNRHPSVAYRSAVSQRPAESHAAAQADRLAGVRDRKSTRLNSSHPSISYAVF